MPYVRKRVPLDSDRAENPTLSPLTQEVRATRTRLYKALRFERLDQLSKEHQQDGAPVRWDASQKLVERAAEDYVAAIDHLLEGLLGAANQLTLASQRERHLPLGL